MADSKPAAPPVDSPAPMTEDQKKLSALDAALKSGVITQEEYIAKKNQVVSEQSAQQAQLTKLKNLDEAFESGVLTKEEYERKKKELGMNVRRAPAAQPPEQPPVNAARCRSSVRGGACIAADSQRIGGTRPDLRRPLRCYGATVQSGPNSQSPAASDRAKYSHCDTSLRQPRFRHVPLPRCRVPSGFLSPDKPARKPQWQGRSRHPAAADCKALPRGVDHAYGSNRI